MTLVIAWRTTKPIEGGHRGLQAYRPICYYFYVFYVFYVFFQNPKNVTFYVFLPCFIRFLGLWWRQWLWTPAASLGGLETQADELGPKVNGRSAMFWTRWSPAMALPRWRININILSCLLLLLYRPKPIHCNYQLVHYSGFVEYLRQFLIDLNQISGIVLCQKNTSPWIFSAS